jgi:mannose-6-phosphate isomerase class I
MAASDNVVRAGLTGKRVDVAEQVFAPGVDEFCLSVISAPSEAEHAWRDRHARTVLCLQGSFSLAAGGTAVTKSHGMAAKSELLLQTVLRSADLSGPISCNG